MKYLFTSFIVKKLSYADVELVVEAELDDDSEVADSFILSMDNTSLDNGELIVDFEVII